MCTSVWEGGTLGLDVLMKVLEGTRTKLWILVLERISTSSAFSVWPSGLLKVATLKLL